LAPPDEYSGMICLALQAVTTITGAT